MAADINNMDSFAGMLRHLLGYRQAKKPCPYDHNISVDSISTRCASVSSIYIMYPIGCLPVYIG